MTIPALKLLAFDFGASSGRAIAGVFDGTLIRLQEIHRFANEPVSLQGRLHWDFLRLFAELQKGLLAFKKYYGTDPDSIGIDTWGVDFGIVDGNGALLENPYHYRDSRTTAVFDTALNTVSSHELFQYSGIQPMRINTMFQLLAWNDSRSYALPERAKLLFMPDLFHYYLTGIQSSEYSIASTSGLIDPYGKTWDQALLSRLSIDSSLFAPIIMPGSRIGNLHAGIRSELQVGPIPVTAVACHDTASAVAAVPAHGNSVFISCGTWSIMGVETEKPVITERSEALGYSNEGGAAGKIRLLKNLMGLWLLQECRRHWELEGQSFTWPQLQAMAEQVTGNNSYIDSADSRFLAPGDMPERIRNYCVLTGQQVPGTPGEIVRCILESLALAYKQVLMELEELIGQKFRHLHMVGGGIQNTLLCRLTADAAETQIVAGPVEATAIGNLLMQAQGIGALGGREELRNVVRISFPPVVYDPVSSPLWQTKYANFSRIVNAASMNN
jgi:rhamnulokinase